MCINPSCIGVMSKDVLLISITKWILKRIKPFKKIWDFCAEDWDFRYELFRYFRTLGLGPEIFLRVGSSEASDIRDCTQEACRR